MLISCIKLCPEKATAKFNYGSLQVQVVRSSETFCQERKDTQLITATFRFKALELASQHRHVLDPCGAIDKPLILRALER